VPTLDVEVVAFDELRLDAGRAVRIELTLLLYGEQRVLLDDTLTVDRPVLGNTPKIEDVVAAMASALDATTELVALKVQAALAMRPHALPPDPEL
jgi:hypothetical protein